MLKGLRSDFLLVLIMLGAAAFGLAQVLKDLSSDRSLSRGRGNGLELENRPLQLAEAARLFEPDAVPRQALPADVPSGFYTTHFEPPPKPPPKKPTTRKVDLTYLGFLQAEDGPRTAVVQAGSKQWTGGVGSNLVANVFVASIDTRVLVVTNTEGRTNQLQFRSKTALDVPAD